jgi:hypothetical protein
MAGEHEGHHEASSGGCCGHFGCGGRKGSTTVSLGLPALGAGLASAGLASLVWSAMRDAALDDGMPPARRPLVVKPILMYPRPVAQHQTSWRNWGGMQCEADVAAEVKRVEEELRKYKSAADFPLEFLPLAKVRGQTELAAVKDAASADVILAYAGGDGAGDLMGEVNLLEKWGTDTLFFVRHQSGPLYYWYEGVSARLLRQHTDFQASKTILPDDVVVDNHDEVLWRLRSLAGLHATRGSRIVAIGGPNSWGWPLEKTLEQIARLWKLDIRTVAYDELGRLIRDAREDQAAVAQARQRAEAYLKLPGTKLETDRAFVEKACLLEHVFRGLMRQFDCRSITVSQCMTTIMPMSQTTACMTLSLLNDAGFLAFCESDFVVIPSGILMANISGRPAFLNDPTYPHDGIITLAHCTAPRKMDGKKLEPARILSHFESDYGAAPKVEMQPGQKVTMVAPDFAARRWLGMRGVIDAHPFLPICRSQIDVRFQAPSETVAERMPGFHWMLVYGEYLREIGYALRRVPIAWDCLR